MRKIPMSGGLPQWPGDDVDFVCQRLAKTPACTITSLVEGLGFEARSTLGQPTAPYFRIRAALIAALKAQRVRRMGRLWGALPAQ